MKRQHAEREEQGTSTIPDSSFPPKAGLIDKEAKHRGRENGVAGDLKGNLAELDMLQKCNDSRASSATRILG